MNTIELTKRGISLIPCGPSKRPLIPWKAFQSRCPTSDEHRAWEKLNPAAWAVVTGANSQVLVLDFDGEDGAKTLQHLALDPHVQTPSGGYHVYVQHPGFPILTVNGKSAARLRDKYPGLDVRGEGGYALAVGRNAEGQYQWLKGPEPLLWDNLPLELKDFLKSLSDAREPKAVEPRALVERAIGMSSGGRNNAAFWLACQLRDNGCSLPEAETAMKVYQSQAPATDGHGKQTELSWSELKDALAQAYSRTPREPWSAHSSTQPNPGISDAALVYPCTDLGNAERLLDAHGQNLRYNVDTGSWMVWNGAYWEVDDNKKIHRLVAGVVRAMRQEAAAQKDTRALHELLRHSLSCESLAKRKAMIESAQAARSYIPVRETGFDQDNMLLNCLNGTVDLRTGLLLPHKREHLISRTVRLDLSPDAQCPAWLTFLGDVFQGDEELIRFFQKALGYSLTGDTSEQVFFLLNGGGSNGKSTLLGVLRDALGDYHRQAGMESFMEHDRGGIPNDIARLRGARLVSASEAGAGRKIAEVLVKQVTGGDAIAARYLRQEFFEFKPQFKLWMACNHLPRIDGQDNAIWRRIRRIPFLVQFGEPDDDCERVKDPLMPQKLARELPGILKWAVEGCLLWQAEGLGNPDCIKSATDDYRASQDIIGDFLRDRCVIGADCRVSTTDLYHSYREWADELGERSALSHRGFTMRMRERGTFPEFKVNGIRHFLGLDLLSQTPE